MGEEGGVLLALPAFLPDAIFFAFLSFLSRTINQPNITSMPLIYSDFSGPWMIRINGILLYSDTLYWLVHTGGYSPKAS